MITKKEVTMEDILIMIDNIKEDINKLTDRIDQIEENQKLITLSLKEIKTNDIMLRKTIKQIESKVYENGLDSK